MSYCGEEIANHEHDPNDRDDIDEIEESFACVWAHCETCGCDMPHKVICTEHEAIYIYECLSCETRRDP